MDWGRRARALFDRHRHQNGRAWTGADIERATRGEVSRFYVSLLQRGLIKDPGFRKIFLISRAIGARPEEWFEDERP